MKRSGSVNARIVILHGSAVARCNRGPLPMADAAALLLGADLARASIRRDLLGRPHLYVDGVRHPQVTVSSSRCQSAWVAAAGIGCGSIGIDVVDVAQARSCRVDPRGWALLEAGSKLQGSGILRAATVTAPPWADHVELSAAVACVVAAERPAMVCLRSGHAASLSVQGC